MPPTTSTRCLLIAAALLLAAAGPKADDDTLTSTRPPESLLGVWEFDRFVGDGIAFDRHSIHPYRLYIDKSVIQVKDQQAWGTLALGAKVERVSYQTNRSVYPPTIDFAPNTRFGGKGIYSIDDDTLSICVGEKRPDAFTAPEGGKRELRLFKRVH
jgi:uncharacterized protein (TIGR03067 family)